MNPIFRSALLGLFLAFIGFLFVGCGRLWGGISWYRGDSTSGIQGIFVGAVGRTSATSGTCPVGTASTWCTGGTFTNSGVDGAFTNPLSLAIDITGDNFYIGDSGNSSIRKHTLSTGTFVGAIGNSTMSFGTCPNGAIAPGWCTGGIFGTSTSDGGFGTPEGIAFNSATNTLFIGEWTNHNLNKLTLSSGAFVGRVGWTSATTGTCPAAGAAPGWCTGGTFVFGVPGDGAYHLPVGVALDSTYIYTTSSNCSVVKINTSTGAFIGSLGLTTASSGTCPAAGVAPGWCTGGTFTCGTSDGAFSAAVKGIAVDETSNTLYISDPHRIQKFNLTTGAFIGAIGRTSASSGTCPASGSTQGWCTGGTFTSGTTDGAFNLPSYIALDTVHDHLYVSDSNNHRVVKIQLSTGLFAGATGRLSASTGTCPSSGISTSGFCTGGTFTSGTTDGALNTPYGISVDPVNNFLYVVDVLNRRVIKMR